MESERPHLSITLPRNFQFHYRDGYMPQTPEPEPHPEELQPPPPPRQTLKVRRRRTTMVHPEIDAGFAMSQRPVPSIEAPELDQDFSSDLPSLPLIQDDAFLSPGVTYTRMLSPPKTPVAQMRTNIMNFDGPENWSDVDQFSDSESSSRPTSSSGFSDSSFSSRGSIDSFLSRGGSCTSPEEDMTYSFLAFSPDVKCGQPTWPLPALQPHRPAKRLKLRATFTEDMDHHLWVTYMKYLQDPTVTPFKALPGSVPPNGVCHRVARMARKTWKGPRNTRLGTRGHAQYRSRSGTEDTIRPFKSGSSTPVPRTSKSFLRYPNEKQCRKRLRDLAKQKPSLSAHYQRLLRRSPSPFQGGAFNTGPAAVITLLTRFRHVFHPRHERVFGYEHCHVDAEGQPFVTAGQWYTTPSSKNVSLHFGLGLGLGHVRGSSFQAMSEMTDMSMHQSNAQTWHSHSISNQPARLGSPFQLHTPRPISRVFKRRALNSSFEDRARNRGNSFVDELFGAPAESSHRRVRSRGFSLGDMVDGARRLPLSTSGQTENSPFFNPGSSMLSSLANSPAISAEMQGQTTVRLGSPFGSRPCNTFPRASTPLSFEPPVSFEQRFAATPSDASYFQR
ncbi:hypothetical protein BDU57DRAFT_449669 [Ampelomyces quisqualis]|uniref:Uncharacterized protein n=1 Tax=Ampelomyces quisqualis TaxID=50730 RepID=A0A6A5QKN9_AMPQU|nr:hypothetical protein BDU57DRAFT_449669 [Ampelomyces quisqualis]